MEVIRKSSSRRSQWSSLFFSLILALILITFVAQALAADGPETESDPAMPTGGETANQAVITGTQSVISQTIELTPTIEVTPSVTLTPTVELTPTVLITSTQMYTTYFPLLTRDMAIAVTKPNNNNQWQVYWEDPGSGATYEIQESKDPNFTTLISNEIIAQKSKDFQHNPSIDNIYYYRGRAIHGGQVSNWAYANVPGAYRDDFNDPSSGWAMRRTTYLEKTDVKYGVGSEAGNLIGLVFDRFDWVIGSPLIKAPEVPYEIEYRARVHDASNLVSGGLVVGGDWNGQACPDTGNYYGTDNCFNHFYNFNYIFYGPSKLLFERVDALYWCPDCGGSQVKRLGDIDNTWPAFDVIDHFEALNWHDYRVEVRHDGMYLYIDGVVKKFFNDTSYINDPYFGVFGSTYEYEPSIWFYDYFQVTPLD
jgi:hypothetical protein